MPSEIERLAARAREEGRLGIDTEFMPEGRYRPLLCLVQVCVGEEVVVLDPIEERPRRSRPRSPRCSPIRRSRSCCTPGARTSRSCAAPGAPTFTNVFDTQIAAGFAGFSAQAGYTGLLHDVLKIRLAKSASFTRWDARPLTPEQLRYAREDVEHLLPLADELQRRLSERGRLDWAREECLRDRRRDRRARPRAGVAAAAAHLGARRRATARSPASWPPGASAPPPPRTARSARWCATRRSSSSPSARRGARRSWAQIRGAGPDVVRRRARDILAAIERGRAAEPIRLDEGERLATDAVDGPTIALAEALVRARAQEAGLAYELIAARADLAPVVVAARRAKPEPDVRTLRGWRRELVGAELLELLAGKRSLEVVNGRVQVA